MQQIRIYFCDFWEEHTFENDFFISILKDKYDFIKCSQKSNHILFYNTLNFQKDKLASHVLLQILRILLVFSQ